MPNGTLVQRPAPGTGPYMVGSFGNNELRLVRNPFFREWSRAAQPNGYPDENLPRASTQLPRLPSVMPVPRPRPGQGTQLVGASGTRGMKVTVWALAELGSTTARYFRPALRRLGYDASPSTSSGFANAFTFG